MWLNQVARRDITGLMASSKRDATDNVKASPKSEISSTTPYEETDNSRREPIELPGGDGSSSTLSSVSKKTSEITKTAADNNENYNRLMNIDAAKKAGEFISDTLW